LQSFSFDEFKAMNIDPHQVYGLDIDYQQYYAIQNYLKNDQDNINTDQKLHILFTDIELFTNHATAFPKIEQAKFSINAQTIYSTRDKTYKSYFLLQHANINLFPQKDKIPELINKFNEILLQRGYIKSDEKLIEINVFTSEIDLIRKVWEEIKRLDPCTISGWNSDAFDIPYTYFRLGNLLNNNEVEIGKILSQFGRVKVEKFGGKQIVKIPEYPVLDLLYAYKPRDDGGLNMGSKQSSYALDSVSDAELGIQKVEYKDDGTTLDNFYLNDPTNFLLYNIADVALCVRLNDKLRHIESYNLLRRLMRTSFSSSLRGSSILFDTYVNYKLNKDNKYTKFGILEENTNSITDDDISALYIPKIMKKTIKEVSQNTFRTMTGHFIGAYVKDSVSQVLTSKDGIIVDLDASSLYPSMINQLNISFDTFFGMIIDPITYKFIALIERFLAANTTIPNQVYISLYEMTLKYVNTLKPQNKTEYVQYYYIIMAYLLKKIETSKKTLAQIFNPSNLTEYFILKRYFLILINMFGDSHPNNKEYNSFCNEYLINDSTLTDTDYLYIVENVSLPTIKIIKLPINEFKNYLIKNNILVSLSGCLFMKHEMKKGLFIDFLKNLKSMRNEYEKERDKFKKGSEEYTFYDMRQKAIKITMNTTL
jgi:DNA polymerase elongation subunit (family B)